MRYMFLLFDDENAWDAFPDADKRDVIGAHMAYTQTLKDAGGYVSGAPLDHSRTARRVSGARGRLDVQDGPFTDAKEQLGGYYMIEAKDLDDALDWAARCPAAAYGRIEVRPIWKYDDKASA